MINKYKIKVFSKDDQLAFSVESALVTAFFGAVICPILVALFAEDRGSILLSFKTLLVQMFLALMGGILATVLFSPPLRVVIYVLIKLQIPSLVKSIITTLAGLVLLVLVRYFVMEFMGEFMPKDRLFILLTTIPYLLTFLAYSWYRNIWRSTPQGGIELDSTILDDEFIKKAS